MNGNRQYDLIVVGLGTSGVFTALSAAQRGLKVLALEKQSYPGGTSTGCFITGCYIQKPSGLMAKYYQRDEEAASRAGFIGFVEYFKSRTEKALLEYGVDIRYQITLEDVKREENRIVSISWVDQALEHFEASGRFFCDCTAEANLCRMIEGVELYGGRLSDGEYQPFTNPVFVWNFWKCFNFDAGRINQSDSEDFTMMQLESTTIHLRDDYYSSEKPIAALGDLPGLREGIHVKTEVVETLSGFFAASEKADEPIFYAYSNIDTHSRDHVLESREFTDWMVGSSMWGTELYFPVSRRALLVRNLENLLVPSRHLGVDHDLGHALRMNPLMGAVGEAAGVWCALAIRQQVSDLRNVPYEMLAEELNLQVPSADCNRGKISLSPLEIWEGMKSTKPGFALWSSRKMPVDGLRRRFAEAAPESDEQCQYAFALALQDDDTGAGLLMKLLLTKDSRKPETSRKYNQDYGVSALYFLGRLGYAAAYESVLDLLKDPSVADSMEYVGGGIAALLDIGEKNPSLRHSLASKLVEIMGAPHWDITARLKGTVCRMKSMAFPLQVVVARRIASWGENALAQTLRMAAKPSDNHEICRAGLFTGGDLNRGGQ